MKIENLQYKLLKVGWTLLSSLPFSVLYFFSDCLFLLFYYIIRYRRKLVRKNLTESFPEKKMENIITIEKKFYHFFMDYIFETCKIATISKEEMKKRMRFPNMNEIEYCISQGQSVSLFLGHYCNWEWISSIPLHISLPFTPGQVYQDIRNKAVNRLFLENRGRFGVNSIELHYILRWTSTHIKNNEKIVVGYIADQSPHWHSINHWKNFLNHDTPVFTGTERITKKYDCQAYFVDVKRVKRGYYEARFIKMHDNPTSLPDFKLTDIYFDLLESTIHRDPTCYLWSHNRFKRTREEYNRIKQAEQLKGANS